MAEPETPAGMRDRWLADQRKAVAEMSSAEAAMRARDLTTEMVQARGLLLNLYPDIVVNGLEAAGDSVRVAREIAAVVHALYPTSPLEPSSGP